MTELVPQTHTPDSQIRPWHKRPAVWVSIIAAALLLFTAGALANRLVAPSESTPPAAAQPLQGPHVSPAYGDNDAVLSVQQLVADRPRHTCTATLVKPEWAITAAHCVTPMPSEFRGNKSDRCASIDLSKRPSEPTVTGSEPYVVRGATDDYRRDGETATVLKVHVLPGWNWGRSPGPMRDLALLQLDHSMTTIKPVTMALTNLRVSSDPMPSLGWGTWPDRCGGILPALQQWNVTPTPCAPADSEGQICAVATDKFGPCEGTSGGPLFSTARNGERQIVAVYSATKLTSTFCGDEPYTYTKLADYADFITATTGT